MDRKSRLWALGAAFLLSALTLGCAIFAPPNWTLAIASFGLVGMAVSANQLISRADGCRKAIPAAVANLYEGTLAFVTPSGYLDDDTGSGANTFGGVVIRNVDNSGGSAGDVTCEVWRDGVFLLTGTGFAQTSVGRDAYATDNYTITGAPSASGVRIGKIVGYVSSTQVYVDIETDDALPVSKVLTKTADYTATVADSGRSFSTAGASGTVVITLPPAVPGLKYRFRVGAAQALRIDPDGTETISLPSTGVPGAAGKYLTADAAGETVDLECVVAGTWTVFGYTGTWTAEA